LAKSSRSRPPRRDDRRQLTDVEWAIMEIVWEHEPCAAGTVQEALADSRGWAYSTVKTTMDRMVAKGLLATRAIRNLTLYSSVVSRQEARRGEFRHFLRRAFDGALTPMIQFLVEEEELSEEEVDELQRLIRRSKRRKP
jgi:predicted transcriptional regulator